MDGMTRKKHIVSIDHGSYEEDMMRMAILSCFKYDMYDMIMVNIRTKLWKIKC